MAKSNPFENKRTYGIYVVLLLIQFMTDTSKVFINAPSVFFKDIAGPALILSSLLFIFAGITFFTGILTFLSFPLAAIGLYILIAAPTITIILTFVGPYINAVMYELILEAIGV